MNPRDIAGERNKKKKKKKKSPLYCFQFEKKKHHQTKQDKIKRQKKPQKTKTPAITAPLYHVRFWQFLINIKIYHTNESTHEYTWPHCV